MRLNLDKTTLKKYNVRVVSITQEFNEEDTHAEFMEGILELVDQQSSRDNAFHTLRGMNQNARDGYYNGGVTLYGYTKRNIEISKDNFRNKLVIVESEAEIVKRIFSEYLKGKGVKTISIELNNKNITKRGLAWSKDKILSMISNTAYTGEAYFNKRQVKENKFKDKSKWIKIECPVIIDKEIFIQAQKARKERSPAVVHPSIASSPILFSRIGKCGKCHDSLQLETGKNNQYRYYNCRTYLRQGKRNCVGNRIEMKILDFEVMEYLFHTMFSKERIKALISQLNIQFYQNRKHIIQISRKLAQEKNKLDKRITNIYKAIENGIVKNADLSERLTQLTQEKNLINEQIDKAKAGTIPPALLYRDSNIEKFRDMVKSAFFSNDNMLAKSYVKLLLKELTINENIVNIKANSFGLLSLIAGEKPTANEVLAVGEARLPE